MRPRLFGGAISYGPASGWMQRVMNMILRIVPKGQN
jgi:hypothetical protein